MKLLKAFFLFIILVACKKEQELVEPECLLSEAEMIDLMIDVSLLKSAKSVGRKELKDSGIKPLDYLFVKHGVDTIIIRENVEYYGADLKKSEELYNKITDKLIKRKEVLDTYVDTLESIKKRKEEELLKEEETDTLSDSDEENERDKLSEDENDSKEENDDEHLEEEKDSLSNSNKKSKKDKFSKKKRDSKDENHEDTED